MGSGMDLEYRVKQQFASNIENTSLAASNLDNATVLASSSIVNTLLQGGKVLSCGDGGAAFISQHFMALMIHRFERERPGLPAISLDTSNAILSSVVNDQTIRAEQLFSIQINALGHPGDILLALATSHHSASINQAIAAAKERQMRVVLINGGKDHEAASLLGEQDTQIPIPGDSTARIQEVQLLVIHCLCDLIDAQLLGG